MVLEVIRKENEQLINRGRREGKKEAIMQTAKKLLKKNMSIEEIEEITSLSKEEIQKL